MARENKQVALQSFQACANVKNCSKNRTALQKKSLLVFMIPTTIDGHGCHEIKLDHYQSPETLNAIDMVAK